MTKKKGFVVAIAICLIAILSLSTLAWFPAEKEVTNEFFVADSEEHTGDEIFSIDLWEETPDSDEDRDGYVYEEILPGAELTKTVHVKNTGYYSQYVRVFVEISDASAWLAALPEGIEMDEVFLGYNAAKWTAAPGTVENNTLTYVLYYNEILDADGEIVLFNAVKIPESLTQDQAAAFGGGFEIKVKAQAVQTENMGATAQEAFATLDSEA